MDYRRNEFDNMRQLLHNQLKEVRDFYEKKEKEIKRLNQQFEDRMKNSNLTKYQKRYFAKKHDKKMYILDLKFKKMIIILLKNQERMRINQEMECIEDLSILAPHLNLRFQPDYSDL